MCFAIVVVIVSVLFAIVVMPCVFAIVLMAVCVFVGHCCYLMCVVVFVLVVSSVFGVAIVVI